ncbi:MULTISPECIES: SDR family oxidoreductase [unclassified Nocardioides]|uniref:SDR family oxidoreductase n=1 Tax=unclassified Nocardioides TaxID=2615069 RepID=UPI000056F44A|nr:MULTISPECIES: SDR family oxidoreductase [unclassified Nocardioides]ABL82807.1 NAD-dependent epimerase/dehydratase [Nocardioides sp. JS614]
MTVLVTGGTGYLGSLVVRRLADRGIGTVSVDVRDARDPVPGVTYVTADLRGLDLALLMGEHEVDAVVHLAAIVEPPKGMSEAELEDIEVGGTQRVVDGCLAAGVGHLTVTSSGAAYGYLARNDGRLLTEDHPVPGSDEFAYSRHKAAVEALLAGARRLHPELGQLVLRPGTILGAHTDNQITALFTGRIVMTLAETDGPFTFIWDEDVADIVVAGVLARRTGTYNLAGDGVMTLRDIAAVEGTRVVAVPAVVVRTALAAMKRLGVGRYGPEQVEFLLHRPVLDNSRLRRDFPGLPTLTTRETYEVFRQGRSGRG